MAMFVDSSPPSMNEVKDRNSNPSRRVTMLPENTILDDTVGPILFGDRIVASVKEEEEKPWESPLPKPRNGTSGSKSERKPATIKPLIEQPTLRRIQSEPANPSLRRSIFGEYWDHGDEETSTSTPPSEIQAMPLRPATQRRRSVSVSVSENPPLSPPPRRARSVSIDVPDRLHPATPVSALRRFLVPRDHHICMGEHFVPLGQLGLGLDRELPALPTPLQRFFRQGNRSECRGVYPLNAPQSILRQSSYRKLLESRSLPAHMNSGSFNLTQTCHNDKWSKAHSNDETSITSSTSTSRTRVVQFDPRVTVTEFSDDAEREWFSEIDLERFKYHTIALAQQYLVAHPEMFEEYSKSRLDPVTGTLRKKALFSMPVLSSNDETSIDELVDHTCKEMAHLAEHEIKNILIVDPNKVVLDLFRRCLQPIFPHAKITVVETGEEALRMFSAAMPDQAQGSKRGFDVVITEERLAHLASQQGSRIQGGKSEHQLDGLACPLTNSKLVVKQDSLSSLSRSSARRSGMSGSELLGKISELERNVFSPESTGDKVDASPSIDESTFGREQWRALLVGVSVDPEADAQAFVANGADLLWGKVSFGLVYVHRSVVSFPVLYNF